MTAGRHTPGPLTDAGICSVGHMKADYHILDAKGNTVATVHSSGNDTAWPTKEQRDNLQRLFLAAPELLSALKRFESCQAWLMMMSRDENEKRQWAEACTVARAAIRRARGE